MKIICKGSFVRADNFIVEDKNGNDITQDLRITGMTIFINKNKMLTANITCNIDEIEIKDVFISSAFVAAGELVWDMEKNTLVKKTDDNDA